MKKFWKKKQVEKEYSTETLTNTQAGQIQSEAPVESTSPNFDLMDELSEIVGSEDEEVFSLQPLTPADANYDDIMEKFVSAPTKPKYWFKEQGDHWYCSCGQLNGGDFCTNCGLGRDLLRTLFFLHEPGDNSQPSNDNTAKVSNGNISSRAKLIIAIVTLLILLLATGIFSYYKIIKPSMEAEAEARSKAMAESMETNVVLCGSNINSFLRESYITAGDNAMKNDKFKTAIRFYKLAANIEKSDGLSKKINEAKYQYVLANKETGGDTFEKYLSELMDIEYSNVGEIYAEYFAWHFNVIANNSPDDTTSDITTFSRSDTVFFHVFASGGAPDETIDVYYEAIWPSGHKQTDIIGSNWTAGSKGTAKFSYPVPLFAQEGKLSFKVYNKSTQELLAEDSITFSK